MTDLRGFASLQARVYEFLEGQDESTLLAIASGAVRLAVLPADQAAAPPSRRIEPSSDPYRAAQDLAELASEDERRRYMTACNLPVRDLKLIAKLRGLHDYSALRKQELVELLAGNGTARPAVKPKTPPTPHPATKPDANVTAVATHLRELETEDEGSAYLEEQRLDRDSLLAVAAELGLSRMHHLGQSELEKRVLKQAIGARRKFSGLRKW